MELRGEFKNRTPKRIFNTVNRGEEKMEGPDRRAHKEERKFIPENLLIRHEEESSAQQKDCMEELGGGWWWSQVKTGCISV